MPTANEKETAQILKSRELREIMGYVQTKRAREWNPELLSTLTGVTIVLLVDHAVRLAG